MSQQMMQGIVLPGDRTARVESRPLPEPGHGQVLLRMRASGICGSDLSYIWSGHKTFEGVDGPAYRGVIAGHEPAGMVVAVGDGVVRTRVGDRVLLYHIVGCGQCRNCRAGYYISCSGVREAYGWQRDGGHGEFILADERTVIPLPDALTYEDGALVACGFGTAYEGLLRVGVNGQDEVLVTGLGPVGLAAAMLSRAMGARRVVGVDLSAARLDLAVALGLIDDAVPATEDAALEAIEANGGEHYSVAVDCSGHRDGRRTALRSTGEWGRVSLLGEGGDLLTDVSDTLLHRHLTIHASWVTSLARMEQLTLDLVAWGLHPDVIVTDRLTLSDADAAYALAASGASGKVCLIGSPE